jgi:hypothetical protein
LENIQKYLYQTQIQPTNAQKGKSKMSESKESKPYCLQNDFSLLEIEIIKFQKEKLLFECQLDDIQVQ